MPCQPRHRFVFNDETILFFLAAPPSGWSGKMPFLRVSGRCPNRALSFITWMSTLSTQSILSTTVLKVPNPSIGGMWMKNHTYLPVRLGHTVNIFMKNVLFEILHRPVIAFGGFLVVKRSCVGNVTAILKILFVRRKKTALQGMPRPLAVKKETNPNHRLSVRFFRGGEDAPHPSSLCLSNSSTIRDRISTVLALRTDFQEAQIQHCALKGHRIKFRFGDNSQAYRNSGIHDFIIHAFRMTVLYLSG